MEIEKYDRISIKPQFNDLEYPAKYMHCMMRIFAHEINEPTFLKLFNNFLNLKKNNTSKIAL